MDVTRWCRSRCGTAYRNKGVQPLLDAIVDYMPSPLDIPADPGHRRRAPRRRRLPPHLPTTSRLLRSGVQDRDRPAMWASCASSVSTPARWTLALGRATTRRSGTRERIGPHPAGMHANHREDLEMVYAGDIAAAVGLEEHHHRRHAVRREAPGRPGVDGVPGAGDPRGDRAEDQGRPGEDGHRAGEAGRGGSRPSSTYTDEETGQTIIAGMGELHLEIIVDRLLREFKVEAECRLSRRSAYREADAQERGLCDMKYARQSGGKGQYGHVKIIHGAERVRARATSSSTRSWAALIAEGVHRRRLTRASRAPCRTGVLAGYNVVDAIVNAVRRLVPRGGLLGDGV